MAEVKERIVTHEMAREAFKKYHDHAFHGAPRPSLHVPVDPNDADVVLGDYIRQQAAVASHAPATTGPTLAQINQSGGNTDSPAPSAPASSLCENSTFHSDPTATQSGASATQGAREPHDGWMNVWIYNNIARSEVAAHLWTDATRKMAGDWADFRTESLRSEVERLKAERDAREHWLQNLLAVIHRDGGHYVAQHGIQKATEDAEKIVLELRAWRAARGERKG